MRINDKYILFWNGTMSNWAHTPYWWGGCHFENSEQHYMWLKAMHFGNEATAKKILRETNPKIAKSLGRKISGYDDDEWTKHRGNMKKRINPSALNQYLSEGWINGYK